MAIAQAPSPTTPYGIPALTPIGAVSTRKKKAKAHANNVASSLPRKQIVVPAELTKLIGKFVDLCKARVRNISDANTRVYRDGKYRLELTLPEQVKWGSTDDPFPGSGWRMLGCTEQQLAHEVRADITIGKS